MSKVVIGVDPHKSSHTAVAVGLDEVVLGKLQVRASAGQAEKLLGWAAQWPERSWAVEGAGGLGHLLALGLVEAGEEVVDVQPKLAARVRLLGSRQSNKNDPNDARSVALAALRDAGLPAVTAEDHSSVLKLWAKRRRDLASYRTQVVCRLHALVCELVSVGEAGDVAGMAVHGGRHVRAYAEDLRHRRPRGCHCLLEALFDFCQLDVGAAQVLQQL